MATLRDNVANIEAGLAAAARAAVASPERNPAIIKSHDLAKLKLFSLVRSHKTQRTRLQGLLWIMSNHTAVTTSPTT